MSAVIRFAGMCSARASVETSETSDGVAQLLAMPAAESRFRTHPVDKQLGDGLKFFVEGEARHSQPAQQGPEVQVMEPGGELVGGKGLAQFASLLAPGNELLPRDCDIASVRAAAVDFSGPDA